MSSQSPPRWAAEWHSCNKADGVSRHLLHDDFNVKLFTRRCDCVCWIRQHYGYIAKRRDLRREPHGWRMPRPVRVTVKYQWETR